MTSAPNLRLVASEDADLTEESRLESLSERRRLAFQKLAQLIEKFVALEAAKKIHATIVDGPSGSQKRWLQWEQVETAYKAFRLLYVAHRRQKAPKGQHDPTLVRWLDARGLFQTALYGPKESDGKRRFKGVPTEVASVMSAYQKLRGRYAQRSPEARAKKTKYMKGYMAARRAAAKAKAGQP